VIVAKDESLSIKTSEDVVRVRQVVRAQAIAAGFGLVDQTKIVTAASEIARNAIDYAGGASRRCTTGRGAACA
jgi:serine/threonine-protein kinase RsbT